MTTEIQPEAPNTVATTLRIWGTAAAAILTIVVVIPCATVVLFWIYFACGGRVGN